MTEVSKTDNARWIAVCTSLAGTSHSARGAGCQDVSGLRRLGLSGEVVLLALSDGAGGASHSQIGAQTVVRHWIEHFTRLLGENPKPDEVLLECGQVELLKLLGGMRSAVEKEAHALGVEPAEFSATLLGAVLTPFGGLVAQVGDGCWVGVFQGVLGCLTWPTGGEFAGQTVFATSEAAPHALQLVHFRGVPAALAGFTDGMERLLLDFRTQMPAGGFFLPVFRALKDSPETFRAQLEAYLQSAEVCERTDDDKSIGVVLNPKANF